jgi:hypothetical protein
MTPTSLLSPVSACSILRELPSASACSDPNPSSRNSVPRRAPEFDQRECQCQCTDSGAQRGPAPARSIEAGTAPQAIGEN